MKFKDTYKFREAAIFFEKNNCYTKHARGTAPFREYWEEEDRKCKEGLTIEGVYITGVHYFYLNYTQMLGNNEGRKKMIFPRFLDIDYDYFHIVERARKEKKGVILVKPRRTGFSYKNAGLITHEYNFYRDSKNIIGSFTKALSEHTMKMCLENLNFLDKHTEWKKQRNPDTTDYVKARYKVNLDGIEVWKGYNSDIMTMTFLNNPFAAVGKSASVFLFEECGKFENLISSYNITEPCWKDGEDMIGIPILFGTGGDMEGGTRDFHEMFYNPEKYNLLSFENTWDESKAGTTCGYFLSSTRGRLGSYKGVDLVDEDGNSNEAAALESILNYREVKSKGEGKAGNDAITQYPLNPQEAFLRSKGNIFPTVELAEWLSTIETDKKLRSESKPGELYFDTDNKLRFKLNADLEPIMEYPLRTDDNKTGCVMIYEEPEKFLGEIPYGLYLAGCDPYDQDKSGTGSLGSFFVYKTFITANKTYNLIVAEYTGRPELADEFYENCRRLCIYYNAKCLYENQLKGLKVYFETKHSLHYLYETPGILKDMVKNSKVQRGYGIHMNRGGNGSSGIKDQCEIYLKQWLMEERTDVNGKSIMNLHTILSIPLLKELIAYNREDNFDRVIAFMLCILQSKENHKIKVETTSENYQPDIFFTKKYFIKHNQIN